MNRLEAYLNDPDIINEPMPLREVHAIRLMIQDETKFLSSEEKRKAIKKSTTDVLQKHGIANLVLS